MCYALVQHVHSAIVTPLTQTILMKVKRPPDGVGQSRESTQWSVQNCVCRRGQFIVELNCLPIDHDGATRVVEVVGIAQEVENFVIYAVNGNIIQTCNEDRR